jgi:alpha-beta hydrolase superfamily lysophospholipase
MADWKHETWEFQGKGGVSLYAQAWIPAQARATMIVVHGLGEHVGRYGNVVEYFCPRGFAVLGYDQRGFGRSQGRRAYTDSLDDFLDDLDTFVAAIRERRPCEKIVIVGHSMGGLIVLRWAATRDPRVAAVISSGAALEPGEAVPALKRLAAKIFSRIAPTLSMANEVNAADLSHDPAVVKAYEDDPLVIRKITARLGYEILSGMGETLGLAGRVTLPLLLLHGGDDHLVAASGTVKFHEATRAPDKRLHLYPGLYHEIFNERGQEKEKVFRDMESWLRALL